MKKAIITAAALLGFACAQAHVWDELATLARPNENGTFDLERYCFIQPSTFTNAIFFDFNNDGHLDLLFMGQGGDWNFPGSEKYVILYCNLGPDENYRFERVTDSGFRQARDEGFYNPLSTGDFNRDGYIDVLMMSNDGTARVELYLNDHGTGHFTPSATVELPGTSNGSVMLGDIDGDGLLDIQYSGSNASGPVMQLYRNLGDGTVAAIPADNLPAATNGQSTLADIDGDGSLDIIVTGEDASGKRLATLCLNQADGWKTVAPGESGLKGVKGANPLVADLNADGIMDLVISGETSDGTGYRTRIYYGNSDGKYTLDSSFPIIAVNQDGGINMGDWNGDGNMDIIVGGYLGSNDGDIKRYSAPLRVYENKPADAGIQSNTRPEAPTDVTASLTPDGIITIDWTDGSDDESPVAALRYNIYVKNETTGELYTMIPVDPATGLLKTGTDLQTSLGSGTKHYEIKPLGNGSYTIGVQTLDQAYAGSQFATTTLDVALAGINDTAISADESEISVTISGLTVTVDTISSSVISIYTPDGRLTASAATIPGSTDLTLPMAGIYIINVITPDETRNLKIAAK